MFGFLVFCGHRNPDMGGECWTGKESFLEGEVLKEVK